MTIGCELKIGIIYSRAQPWRGKSLNLLDDQRFWAQPEVLKRVGLFRFVFAQTLRFLLFFFSWLGRCHRSTVIEKQTHLR